MVTRNAGMEPRDTIYSAPVGRQVNICASVVQRVPPKRHNVLNGQHQRIGRVCKSECQSRLRTKPGQVSHTAVLQAASPMTCDVRLFKRLTTISASRPEAVIFLVATRADHDLMHRA